MQNTDVFDRLALRLRYAWLRGRSANFNIEGSFDTQNETQRQHLILSLTGRAQTSFNQPLLNSERIGIANTSALSAFDSGTLVGDQGYVVRGELQSPWSLPQTGALFSNATGRNIGVVISPYLFAAYGEVLIEDPTILEVASIRAASYGVGVRFGGAAAGTLSNGSLGLEYGYATRSDNMPSDHRFTIVSSVRF